MVRYSCKLLKYNLYSFLKIMKDKLQHAQKAFADTTTRIVPTLTCRRSTSARNHFPARMAIDTTVLVSDVDILRTTSGFMRPVSSTYVLALAHNPNPLYGCGVILGARRFSAKQRLEGSSAARDLPSYYSYRSTPVNLSTHN